MTDPANRASSCPCPICRRSAAPLTAPFCSPRCRDRDLARWFSDGYSVPGPPASTDDLLDGQ